MFCTFTLVLFPWAGFRNNTPWPVYEIQAQNRSEKHVGICSGSQAVLKALQAKRRTSLLVLQCQKALNDISSRHAVGLYGVPGHAGIPGNEIADELAGGGSVLVFLGPEPTLGVSRREIQKRPNRWLFNPLALEMDI